MVSKLSLVVVIFTRHGDSGHVKTYTIVVHDRREREPMTLTAVLAHDARACEFGLERLGASVGIEAVEVWCNGVKLYQLSQADAFAAA